MPASTTMTIRLTPEVKDKLERIATESRRTKSFLAGEALAAYVDREMAIIEGIQHGIADMKSGRAVPHEEVMADARQIIDDVRRRKAEEK